MKPIENEKLAEVVSTQIKRKKKLKLRWSHLINYKLKRRRKTVLKISKGQRKETHYKIYKV